MTAAEPTHHARMPVGLLVGLVLGLPFMAVGILDFVNHFDATEFESFARFYVGADVLHDLVVAPIAALIGVLVIRRMPVIARAPVRAALFGTAIVVAVAWPALRGYGRMRTPDNASVQPLDYTTAVATVVAVVWAIAATWLALELVAARRSRRRAEAPSEISVSGRIP